jgi:hypothetical protein
MSIKKQFNARHYLPKVVVLFALVTVGFIVFKPNKVVHANAQVQPRAEITQKSAVAFNIAKRTAIGAVYEAFLSPQQEGGEESDTPSFIPPEFRSTAPSVNRNERPSRGHAVLEFNNELSKAYVHLSIENVKLQDINMLHLHCGRPGQLGPIIVDFSLIGNINAYLSDGKLSVEVVNEDIVAVTDHAHGVLSAFTAGCPIVPSLPMERVKTIAGMAYIAQQGDLYFNLHTKGQTYFGDIRGQFKAVQIK